MTFIFTAIVSGVGCSIAGIGVALVIKGRARAGNGLMALGNWILFLNAVAVENHFGIAINGLAGVLSTYLWWKNGGGRKGRKAARELGAKSKARVQALVDQMTPSPIPSPAGGAR